jgi:thioesterase domain-containing protein
MSARAVERNLKLTVHDLFLAPILRDLAQRVAESSPVAATAVPARRSGVQPPVFFVPTGLGRYDYAFAFAKDIRIDCPVYAVPWPSSQVEPLPAIEEMARAMAVMIQRVQPRGPYRLAGYSSGGVLAYAIADYFLQAGEPVSFLGLLDCRLPAEKSPSSKTARESLIDLLEARDSSAALRDLSMDALVDVARNLGLVGPRARAEDVENGHHFTRALSCYRPPSLPIRLHIFHATEQSPEQTGTITLGWERVLPASALHPVPAPGSHRSIMENPSNRAELGRLFSEALRGPA